jgi:RHS repeat-associated protein
VTALAVNGTSVPFTYDNDSLLIQAGALVLSRDSQNGLLTGTTLGSAADTWAYNAFAEPTTYTATYGGPTVFAQQNTRDKLGRITQKIETIGGITDTYVYSYDVAGRLTGVAKNAVTTATYTYDSSDNRLSSTNAGGTTLGTYDNQDRLAQYGIATYAYSANGELQSSTSGGQVTTYQYDALGNLMAVTLPTGTSIAYLVDGSNRRVGKQVNGAPTQRFLYQDTLKPIAELDAGNNVVSRFVYATRDNVPDYMIKGGVSYRIVTDHLGSPRLVVNAATGAIAQRMDYDEFGRVVNDTSPGFQPFGFAGGLYDKDTQLVRFGARDYDAATGRWTAKDPILFAGGQANLYTYVRNDPVNLRDPGGLQSLPDYDKQQQEKNKDSCPPPKIKPPPKKNVIKEYQKTREEFAGEKSSQSAKDYSNSVKNNFTSVGGNY